VSDVRPFYRRRSLFGPLVVVAIGIAFLLRNFGVISYRSFGWWFARYWPLLLIFWGVVKFLEYLWARHRNEPYPGVGAGGVVFLIFLVIFGVAATGASRMDWGWVYVDPGDEFTDTFGIFGTRYDFTESFAQSMPTATQVKVLSARGDVSITPSPDNQAHVLVHKYTRSHSQDEANQFNNSTHAQFQQQGTVWLLDLTTGNFSEGRFDLVIQVPSKYAISLLARHGDIHVSQMQSDLDLEANHGDITTEQIAGTVFLRPHRNDVTVTNVKGNVTIDGDVGDSSISEVTGTLTFSTGFSGDLQFSHIFGPVHFKSLRTDLQFGKLDGDLNMDGNDLRANSVAGPFTLSTQTKDIHLEDITGSVHIDDRRGDIEVEAKAPLGNVDISTTGGEINISLPEKPGFQLDAESDSGEIQSDFSLSVNNQTKNATATGAVGTGGPVVKLKTNRGTIQIHKAG
jgi:DUF4097 and DUF4098 domain-containing protein YvlB